ncbi:class I adenylate-forming enzyme family protein [Halorientalis salina]|uniref:class I adenylate-forming enzyme family protein n=1 Tax=Halorientalis salina TaxID=2932266 RepID=UPI0010ACFB79|nr:long-chain fatty acid--CoA ligase [Halorientalis salina]
MSAGSGSSESRQGRGEATGAPSTLIEALIQSLDRFDDRVAVTVDGSEYTYGELDERSNAVANALVDRGVEPGDRVALMMSNCLGYVIADLALLKAGAVKLPLNDMLTEDEFEYMLSDSGAETVIAGPGFTDTLASLDASVDSLDRGIVIDSESDQFDSLADLESDGDPTEPPSVSVSPESPVGHFYTGGTTGDPKGVIHSHDNFLQNMYAHITELDMTGDDTLLLMTPLPHSAGLFLWAAMLLGAKSVIRPGFDPEQALRDIEDHEVTWSFLVPTMIYTLLDDPALDETDTSSLETLIYGAAPMTPARLREGLAEFGPVFTQFYGQTEVPNLITVLGKEEHRIAIEEEHEQRLGSAGQPTLMADVKIVDTETGEEQPPGREGEIMASAPYVMDEYWGLPEKTAETVEDGWVHTGDIGKRDEDGYVYLLDRKSNMIISGGMNVYSTDVEDVLATHPDVAQVAVIGVPDEKWGEAVTAIIVPDGEVTQADIDDFADEELGDYKRPKHVEFRDELPKTPYGKIDKKALREPYWDDSDRSIN